MLLDALDLIFIAREVQLHGLLSRSETFERIRPFYVGFGPDQPFCERRFSVDCSDCLPKVL
jgi:hypothetical protein